jgi:FkbM family methyltransferase
MFCGLEHNVFPSPVIQVPIQTPQGQRVVAIPHGERFRVDHIFNQQEYSIDRRFLPSTPLVAVDVGANVGLFTLYLKSVRPDCAVHCFEPAPHSFELLRHNLQGLDNVHLYPFGLGSRTFTAAMALHPQNSGQNSIKLGAGDASRRIGVPIVASLKAFARLGLDYVDLLKIDTEGCEVEILRNLLPRLDYVGLVLIEYHSDSDRRAIDGLLAGFNLIGACAVSPEVGIVKYINKKLISA